MPRTTDAGDSKVLVISRSFPAPRALVFRAWSSAEHMQRWFSPEGLTVPTAEVDFRPGGACTVCMRAPDGEEFWSRGTYTEITPPERLAFTSTVTIGGAARFTVATVVTFTEEAGGTRLSVRQAYTLLDPGFPAVVENAAEGWRSTLDKLARELGRLAADSGRSVVHASFTLERVYAAVSATVFRALTDPAAKARWFAGGEGFTELVREMDAHPGGRERLEGRWANGTVSAFAAVYLDIVPERRVVYAYDMHLDGRKISVSLATLELAPAEGGTRLTLTEHGAFLDGYEDGGARAHGTGLLLDRLGASLAG